MPTRSVVASGLLTGTSFAVPWAQGQCFNEAIAAVNGHEHAAAVLRRRLLPWQACRLRDRQYT